MARGKSLGAVAAIAFAGYAVFGIAVLIAMRVVGWPAPSATDTRTVSDTGPCRELTVILDDGDSLACPRSDHRIQVSDGIGHVVTCYCPKPTPEPQPSESYGWTLKRVGEP
jgi:hypothetical protein